MSDQQSRKIAEAIREIAERARKYREQYRERGLGEENTKASLIEPLLESLGWSIRDVDEVHREFRPTPKDNPVDYCLRLMRDTRLLIEAKGLGEDLDDRRWLRQTLSYATMAGAKWCVLTDGDEYRIYSAIAPVAADDRLFCRVKLSDGPDEEAANVLGLLSRSNTERDVLSSVWNIYVIDRNVKSTVRELVDTVDRKLILLIRKRNPNLLNLPPKEIAASIRRLDIRIDAPAAPYELRPTEPSKASISKVDRGKKQTRKGLGVTLTDLIAAGYLSAPLALFRKYKGRQLEAKLLPEGKVEFEGTVYDSGSTAAEVARSTVTGRRMNTNGWVFWQYRGNQGQPLVLDDTRKRFIEAKGKS
jgi:predicted type IV restriction endonuclease